MSKSKGKGAVRKTTEDGAKAPDSTPTAPAAETEEVIAPVADEVPGGAAVPEIDEEAAKKLAEEVAAIEAAVVERGHFIAEGKCISCKKGNLGPGERVKAEYFGVDGAAIFERLVESDAIVEVK
jgi:hypothetical protein